MKDRSKGRVVGKRRKAFRSPGKWKDAPQAVTNAFDPHQPRVPAGSPNGGEFASGRTSDKVAVAKESNIHYRAVFEHDGHLFHVNMFNVPDDRNGGRTWGIAFGIADKDDVMLEMKKTGTSGGAAVAIFRKVGSAVNSFVEQVQPERFHFSADASEPTRVKLYDKLSKVLATRHGYDVVHRDLKDVERTYYFKKAAAPVQNSALAFEEELVGEVWTVVANVFCPTGEGGGVNPTCSPGGVGREDSSVSHAGVKIVVEDLRQKWGYHGPVEVLDQHGPEFEAGGVKWREGGRCWFESGRVVIHSQSAGTEIGDVRHLAAHEFMHGAYALVDRKYQEEQSRASREPVTDTKSKYKVRYDGGVYPQYVSEFPTMARLHETRSLSMEKLKRDDGITEYSKAYWRDFEAGKVSGNIAIHETLAEIAGIHEATGVIHGSKVWKDFYKSVRDEYRVLTAQQRKRKGPGLPKVEPTTNVFPTTHELYLDASYRPTTPDRAKFLHWWGDDMNGWAVRSLPPEVPAPTGTRGVKPGSPGDPLTAADLRTIVNRSRTPEALHTALKVAIGERAVEGGGGMTVNVGGEPLTYPPTGAGLSEAVTIVVNKFNAGQVRDKNGRWAKVGAGAGAAAGFTAVSSLKYREAEKRLADARLQSKAAYDKMHDPSVPIADALAAGTAAERELAAAKDGLAREGRHDLMAYLSGGKPPAQLRGVERVGTSWTEAERNNHHDALEFVRHALPSDATVPDVYLGRPTTGNRAVYDHGTIRVSRADDAGTVAHEIGHHLEAHLPGAKEKAREFQLARVGGETPTRLADKFPTHGYDREEYGRADDFRKLFPDNEALAYYVGKHYPGREGQVSEIVSMGLELMYRDARHFARTDPEYFDTMVSILRGRGGPTTNTFNPSQPRDTEGRWSHVGGKDVTKDLIGDREPHPGSRALGHPRDAADEDADGGNLLRQEVAYDHGLSDAEIGVAERGLVTRTHWDRAKDMKILNLLADTGRLEPHEQVSRGLAFKTADDAREYVRKTVGDGWFKTRQSETDTPESFTRSADVSERFGGKSAAAVMGSNLPRDSHAVVLEIESGSKYKGVRGYPLDYGEGEVILPRGQAYRVESVTETTDAAGYTTHLVRMKHAPGDS